MISVPSDFSMKNDERTLVVFLHGVQKPKFLVAIQKRWTLEPLDDPVQSLKEVVGHELGTNAILCPDLPTGVFSFTDPDEIVEDLVELIDKVWKNRETDGPCPQYTRIILIGQSLGALLARKLYVRVSGEYRKAPFSSKPIYCKEEDLDNPKCWADRVERIILFAGINRGWTISHRLSPAKTILFRLGVAFGYLAMAFHRIPLLFHIRRGAQFITQLRIQWLAMIDPNREPSRCGQGKAMVIQLLGSVDEIVAPEDDVDMVSGEHFCYLDVPKSNHINVIQMGRESSGITDEEKTCRNLRRNRFVLALTQPDSCLKTKSVQPTDNNLVMPKADRDVTDVVFVIHGIRDRGYWTHKIARKVVEVSKKDNETCKNGSQESAEYLTDPNGGVKQRKFATETSSYGYFPMLPFVFPWGRRTKVEWFMDQYTENLALYPDAKFSFVGHSNGTYLLSRSLKDYPSCRFENVVLAGSVVRTNYEWDTILKYRRVKHVLNYVATSDWVVAFTTKGLEVLRLFDLGGAGFDGFESNKFFDFSSADQVEREMKSPAIIPGYQIKYVTGAHSGALKEEHWKEIARFIVHGRLTEEEPEEEVAHNANDTRSLFRDTQSFMIEVGSDAFLLIWGIAAIVLIAIAFYIWGRPWPEWTRTLVLILYARVLWTIVTEV